MRGLLRGTAGASEPASRSVFPSAVDRLLRGAVVGAWDCVAGCGFVEPAVIPGPGRDGGSAQPLDAVPDPPSDRRGNARGGFHVGSGAVVGGGSGEGEDGRHRCDDSGSERGDAEHRASGHGGIVRGVRGAVGGGFGGCDADACGVGAFRPFPEGPEDVERGVAVSAGPGCEGREDEGRPNAPGAQGRAGSRPGDGGDCVGDGAGCIEGRYGDAGGDADDGCGTGRGGAACGPGGRRGGGRQGLPQRRDAGGARGGRGSQLLVGTGPRPAPLAGQEDG